MFGISKNTFIGLLSFSELLASMVNVSNYTKCICLNNHSCMTRWIQLRIALLPIYG